MVSTKLRKLNTVQWRWTNPLGAHSFAYFLIEHRNKCTTCNMMKQGRFLSERRCSHPPGCENRAMSRRERWFHRGRLHSWSPQDNQTRQSIISISSFLLPVWYATQQTRALFSKSPVYAYSPRVVKQSGHTLSIHTCKRISAEAALLCFKQGMLTPVSNDLDFGFKSCCVRAPSASSTLNSSGHGYWESDRFIQKLSNF